MQLLPQLEADVKTSRDQVETEGFEVEIEGQRYTNREEANQTLRFLFDNISTHLSYGSYRPLGHFLGFEFGLTCKSSFNGTELYLKGASIHYTRFVSSRVLAQLEALGRGFEERLSTARFSLSESHQELEKAKEQVAQPFAYASQLKELQAEKATLDLELGFEQAYAS